MARVTLERNVKFKALIKRLKKPKPYVRGVLETLWDVAHECGNPVLGTEEDVELAAEWPGKKGALFEALKAGKWIEQNSDARWQIHDYWDHAPDYVRDRRRKELSRKYKHLDADSPGHSGTFRDNPARLAELSGTPAPAPAPAPLNTPATSAGNGSEAGPPSSDRQGDAVAKPKRARKEPTGPHADLIRHFTTLWRERYGESYEVMAKDGVAASKVLKAAGYDFEQAEAIVGRFMACNDPFIVRLRHPLTLLMNQLNRFKTQADVEPTESGFVRAPVTEDVLRWGDGGES